MCGMGSGSGVGSGSRVGSSSGVSSVGGGGRITMVAADGVLSLSDGLLDFLHVD